MMNTAPNHARKGTGWLWRAALIALAIAALGFGGWKFYQYRQLTAAQTAAIASGKYQTSAVSKATLSVSISGSGTVVTTDSAELSFATSGKIATLSVQVGDTVTKGQVLAQQANLDLLQLAVDEQKVAVQAAQLALDEIKNNPQGSLATALSEQAAAEEALVTAQNNLHDPHDGRCSTALTKKYYDEYGNYTAATWYWQERLSKANDVQKQFVLQNLNPLLEKAAVAYANYLYCYSYTPAEITASQANLQVAQASAAYYQARYTALKAANGVDPAAQAVAEAALNNANLQLETAQKNLTGATIVAPMDGVITAVNGVVGQDSGTGAVLTVSDMARPYVQVNVDETDLSNFAVGCPAKVTFTGLSHQTFTGSVTSVSPTLVTVSSVSMVQGTVSLDKNKLASGKLIPPGLTGTVQVTCQTVQNALKVPLEALYEPAGASPYVYVLNAAGKPEKREVTTGLKTVASVEIKSGLSEGEQVILNQISQ